MSAATGRSWTKASRAFLAAALAVIGLLLAGETDVRGELAAPAASTPRASTRGPDGHQLVEDAVAAYAAAQDETGRSARLEGFRRAERLFAAAVGAGNASAALYANLGNAALQAERLGPAILAYRRALQLDPGLQRAQQNLDHARTLLPDWVPSPERGGVLDSFFFWHRTLSRDTRHLGAALFFLIGCLAIAASVMARSSILGWTAAAPLLVWAALAGSLLIDPERNSDHEGVVMAQEVVARASDSINAPVLFGSPLPEGTEVEILEDRGGWLQIRLANGRTAWVQAAGVERTARS